MNGTKSCALALLAALALAGCATESSQALKVAQVDAAAKPYRGMRTPVAVGKFDNRSTFMRGIFSDGIDRLGGQAKSTLVAHLRQSEHFSVLERENLEEGRQEAAFQGRQQTIRGAQYIITGDIAEFGRKDTGTSQLFGLLGGSKTQVAYAKITLNVVDTLTSEVVYSARGAGEYALSSHDLLIFRSDAGYDSTLNGKVLDLAMREAVNRLVEGLDQGQWTAPAAPGAAPVARGMP